MLIHVLADELAQHLVLLRRLRLAADRLTELPFDRREGGLYVRPLVIVPEIVFPVGAEQVPHLFEDAADAAGRVVLERRVEHASVLGDGFEVGRSAVRLVRRDFGDGERALAVGCC